MQIAVGASTDVGMVRSGNEDNFFAEADERRGVFVVADGMGGHAAGEVASEMSVQIIARHLLPMTSVKQEGAPGLVGKAMQDANRAVYDRMLAETDKQGMGTTASVMFLSDHGYLIGQIGDSRVYLLRDGALIQITKDHSYVQEQVDAGLLTPEQARYHPYSNVITRCIGASDEVEADIYSGQAKVGDVFLLCSDGLTGMVDDRRLQQLLLARSGPGRIVDSLIAEANGRGGLDNITAVVVQVIALDESAEPNG
jgi:PPM family protein phosphatase